MQARMRQMSLFAVVAVAFVLVGGMAFAQSDSNLGTWKLNVAKSKYSAGTGNQSSTATIAAAGAGVKIIVDSVSHDGTVGHIEFNANYDGKDNPVVGDSTNGDMVSLTRINATTTKQVYKKAGKSTVTQTFVVSSDGKTRTITATGTNALGQTVNSVTFWDKQ
jgi:hypothetical protein